MNTKISKLIFKSVSKTISEEEKVELNKWLSNPDNKLLYNKITKSKAINKKLKIYNQLDIEDAYRKVELKLIKSSKPRFTNFLKYAAVFVLLFGLGYYFQKDVFNNSNTIEIVEEKITLQLDDGTVKTINEAVNTSIVDTKGNTIGEQNGSQLIYTNDAVDETLVFNTLRVPYGKRFELVLSDGTKVHLNAGTSLKYPVRFLGKGTRKVFLNGEAYFDVAKDSKRPFIVNSDELNVQVLGTEFNVSSYPEDDAVNVVLVEGSVGLYTEYSSSKDIVLAPSFKASYNKNDKKISTQKVQTYLYTSWINGEQLYRNIPFKNILPKLERYYNVKIINTNSALENELFYASFKDQTIENVLTYFNEVHKIQYEIKNNQIFIK